MGWATLCGCLSLFMVTGGARWWVQTGHLAFGRADEFHLSPMGLLLQLSVVLLWSNIGKDCPKWSYLPLLQMLFHITPLPRSLDWTLCSSGFKVPSFLWETLSCMFFTVPGGTYWGRTDLTAVRSSPLPLETALLHWPLLRFSSPPTCTQTHKHTTSPILLQFQQDEKLNWGKN